MRLLLDTNALLWTLAGTSRIEPIRELILSEENEVYCSAVPWWEIAIKTRIGKLDVELTVLQHAARDSGFNDLPLTGRHAEALKELPRHHNDPFDHMLLAQALTEPMRLITGDSILSKYNSSIILI